MPDMNPTRTTTFTHATSESYAEDATEPKAEVQIETQIRDD